MAQAVSGIGTFVGGSVSDPASGSRATDKSLLIAAVVAAVVLLLILRKRK